ncbi:protein RETARDED ROOT GROWTH, mitochondrial isoform X1 [Cryptomeria japonica]|uniref:protein RETARDED ROOT GROWTH, mitochondrial isoform X1 n=1 Tax=Cryptomeria japonica TaxID=3369 RepID=UPI0025AB7D7D|nr:protein RETARDED ROOT GROWTH, mitochondrial isoform X1 [Cryptomeria japonica]
MCATVLKILNKTLETMLTTRKLLRRGCKISSSCIKTLTSPHKPAPIREFNSISQFKKNPLADNEFYRSSPAFTWRMPIRFCSSSPVTEMLEWSKKWPSVDAYDESSIEAQYKNQGTYITVKAYLLGTSVDLKGLQMEPLFDVVPPSSRSANNVVLRVPSSNMLEYSSTKNGLESRNESWSNHRHMVVFQYGSVVLFNFAEQEEEGYLQIVRKYASELLTETRKDDYAIVEKPSLETWMQEGHDYIVLRRFDIDCIRTIGIVLGQSIALDHFVRQVDGMVAEFIDLNKGMEKTGTFTMNRKKLFQLVGQTNTNLANVIFKLGLFERSDVAWKNAKYAQIWEYLRDEYELQQRFGSLDYKLKFVEHNVRFFLEILQNRKSDALEWLIIILISTEIMIGLYDIIRNTGINHFSNF